MTVLELETMIPMNEVTANPIGIVKSCDQRADCGVLANRAKSGSLTIKVAKLAIDDMMPLMTAHARAEPWRVDD